MAGEARSGLPAVGCGPMVGSVWVGMMQRIHGFGLSVEQYAASQAHRQVRPEPECPRCGARAGLHRHGCYERGITTGAGGVVRILVARFLCRICRRTISYLPSFALSYRLVAAATFEAFLQGERDGRDVRRWEEVLINYRRRMTAFAAQVVRTVGCGFGRAPPPEGLWPWLKGACGGLDPPHADW